MCENMHSCAINVYRVTDIKYIFIFPYKVSVEHGEISLNKHYYGNNAH